MKIGEAGEAFFVFETEEDVSEDFLTSPITSPTLGPSNASLISQESGSSTNEKDKKPSVEVRTANSVPLRVKSALFITGT